MAIRGGWHRAVHGADRARRSDDLDAVIKQFIAGAKRSLFIAVQELDSRPVAEAILAAKAAKLKVRMILEGDYLVEDPPLADPWAISGANETNRLIHSALLRAVVRHRRHDDPVGAVADPATRGVLDQGQGTQKWAATQPLKAAGVELFENKPWQRACVSCTTS